MAASFLLSVTPMLWFRRLNLLALFLCFGVIVLGAYVRLSDAGLGCPDWPGCYGHIGVPAAAEEVASAEQRFPQRPVEPEKAWKEMVHRYFASTLGLLIVILAFMSRRLSEAPRVLPWFLVGLVVFQGILGMWTVTWQLKPLAVTAHLFGGLGTLGLLYWQWLLSRRPLVSAAGSGREPRNEREAAFAFNVPAATPSNSSAPRGLRLGAALGLGLLLGQIFLGGWTSTNYAALACPDLPTCHGQWWPDTDVKTAFTLWHGLGINYEYGILDARARVTIHLFHRVGAIIVTVALGLLALMLVRRGGSALWRRLGMALFAALVLQLTLGVSIVLLQLPLGLATAHNGGAALLLLTLLTINFFAWNAPARGRDA